MNKIALITGITGQDGSFLAEFLLGKDYDVHGTIRRSSVDFRERIAHLEGHPHFHLHYADLSDSMSILQVVKKVKPNEIYNLAAARIAQGKQDKLYLGNLSSLRDWGYAKDYVECMWLILQNDKPEDFVIATGEQHSVREFCQQAFRHVGIKLRFEGEGENEKGIDCKTGKVLVEVSPDFYRPTDVVNLWGDPSKAKRELGWNPKKTSFEQLVKIMVDADMAKVAVERASQQVRTNLAEYLEKGIVK